MKNWRIPIALQLFLTVLLTTLCISTISLAVVNWSMRKNFSRYVTQVEMQKLEHLNNNLAEIYQTYGNWQLAINSSKQPDDKRHQDHDNDPKRQSIRWLLRQYEIAQFQSDVAKNHSLFERNQIKIKVPSHLAPYADSLPSSQDIAQADKQMSAADKKKLSDNGFPPPVLERGKYRRGMLVPDRLGLSMRLALYDARKRLIAGDPTPNIPMQPIMVQDKVVGYLGLRPAVGADDTLSINFFSNQQRYLLLIFIVSVLLSAVVALLLANNFRKPIHRLLDAALELSKGHFDYRAKVKRYDELGDLATTINQLAVILEQHEQSRRQWVADTSHELKTPLSVLQAQIEAMQDGVRQATPEHLARMKNQVLSLRKITQDLADLAQADVQQLKCYFNQIHPWQIVLHEVENFKQQFEQKQLMVNTEGEDGTLWCDSDRLRQIIVNLLSNSVRYTEEGGQIDIRSWQTADEWFLQIDDSPLGLDDQQLAHLGERFYRVDDSRTRSTGGTGLGLALSKKIAEALGGSLQFAHSPLGGLRCTVRLNRHFHESNRKTEVER